MSDKRHDRQDDAEHNKNCGNIAQPIDPPDKVAPIADPLAILIAVEESS